jgi:Tfp pilus assembly protein PilO
VAVIYLLIISPILSLQEGWGRELVKKRQLLARYQALQARGPVMARADQALKTALTTLEGQFLAGPNAAVAAADLQEIVKNLAETHGLSITSTKILPSQETGPYVEVPIQVQMSSSINQLSTFLFHLEHHKKLLFIPEIEINSPRRLGREIKSPPLQVNLVILGVIKKKAAT